MVDRVEDDNGIIFHAQSGSRINPVAVPARRAQLRIDVAGVIATLAGDDDIQRLQRFNIKRILQRACRAPAKLRRGLAVLRSRKEYRADHIKIALFTHALHQY